MLKSVIADFIQNLEEDKVLYPASFTCCTTFAEAIPEFFLDFCHVHASGIVLVDQFFRNRTKSRVEDIFICRE